VAFSLYHLGELEAASREAGHGVELWRGGVASFQVEEMNAPVVACLIFNGLCEWHFGQIASGEATMTEAVSVAQGLNDTHGLGAALLSKALFAYYERDPLQAEHFASETIEISLRQNFATWLALGTVLRHWARSVLDRTSEGVLRIGEAVLSLRATRSVRWLPYGLAMKAEALHLGGHTPEALEAIKEAGELTERSGECCWSAELHRLCGIFFAALGAGETQIEASFYEAIRIAREQKSVSLEKRAELTYAEYRRQKASASEGCRFRLPLG
jgi:hypothetical protein